VTDPSARLDAELVRRGLARSRGQARDLVTEGTVLVDGRAATKASATVTPEAVIELARAPERWVGRAAYKLLAALDLFGVPVSGRRCLDVGASTGGFTQVLLEAGAAHVTALDVGHGQLVADVAVDPRVVEVSGTNIRDVRPGDLGDPFDLVVVDLSFISLRLVLPLLPPLMTLDADAVLLVKPQFEVGRTGVREGIVRDAGLRADAVGGVLWSAWDAGLGTAGVIASPIAGSHGNREALVHLTAGGSNPTEWLERVRAVTE
jgi:23S rRNA (cytidine1920-2'-O)/16S rRNA (cytidine1409-2'-O)-methyltransferase